MESEWRNVFLEIEKELMKDEEGEDEESIGESSAEFCDKFVADVLVVEDKKRKRQIRNRDAAVRSRERRKEYVKELELKSRYLEGECRRLSRLLQCCYADNQYLRFGISYKQESAVLLLESLLLGSLLVFLILISLLLPTPPTLLPRGRERSPRPPMFDSLFSFPNSLNLRTCKAWPPPLLLIIF